MTENQKNIKLIYIVFSIFILVSIAISLQALYHPVTLSVIPEVPREGEPLIVTYIQTQHHAVSSNPEVISSFFETDIIKLASCKLQKLSNNSKTGEKGRQIWVYFQKEAKFFVPKAIVRQPLQQGALSYNRHGPNIR